MAYDSQLYLRASSVSGSFYVTNWTIPVVEQSVLPVVLPGSPLRGYNLNTRFTTMTGTTSLQVGLMEATISGGTFYLFRLWPQKINSLSMQGGEVNMRFHLDKGYTAIKALYTLSNMDTAAGVGNLDIRVGLDRGAYGNG